MRLLWPLGLVEQKAVPNRAIDSAAPDRGWRGNGGQLVVGVPHAGLAESKPAGDHLISSICPGRQVLSNAGRRAQGRLIQMRARQRGWGIAAIAAGSARLPPGAEGTRITNLERLLQRDTGHRKPDVIPHSIVADVADGCELP